MIQHLVESLGALFLLLPVVGAVLSLTVLMRDIRRAIGV